MASESAARAARGESRLKPLLPCCRATGASVAGFTLIEVMIALAIVALGMMAVNTQLNRYAIGALYIEQKTLASWIATNKIVELGMAEEWPALGTQNEELEFAERRWVTRTEVAETPVPNLRRVDVRVSLAEDPERELHTVSGFLEPPSPRGFLPSRWPPPMEGAVR